MVAAQPKAVNAEKKESVAETGEKKEQESIDEERPTPLFPSSLVLIIIFVLPIVIGLLLLLAFFITIDEAPKSIDDISVNSGQADITKVTVTPSDRDQPGADTVNLVITVWSGESTLQGVTVTLSGCGTDISTPQDTVVGGTVTFNALTVTLAPGTATSRIHVKCEKKGYANYDGEILVVRG